MAMVFKTVVLRYRSFRILQHPNGA